MEKTKETDELKQYVLMIKAVMVELAVIWILTILYLIKISL